MHIYKPTTLLLFLFLHKNIFFGTVNVLKFGTLYSILNVFWSLFFMQLFLKILDGMTNSVDPDQAVPSGAV